MEEIDFLAAIAAAPTNDAVRLVYADWLDDRGDPRGEYMRFEIAFHGTEPNSPRRVILLNELRRIGLGLDSAWLAAVSRVPIEQCVPFRFPCPERWENLTATTNDRVRDCKSCRQQVFYCDSIEEARQHAQQGHCVAVDPRLTRQPGDIEPKRIEELVTLGLPDFDWQPGKTRPEPPPRRGRRRRK